MTRILRDLFSTKPKRQYLLNSLIPAIFVIYFGSLAAAIQFSREAYDWRRKSISWLLYPHNDPSFHIIASLAVAVTGLLMMPFAAYIRARLRSAFMIFTDLGALILGLGALLLILAGLIVSHPYAGKARFPRLHEALARGAAFALGMGMLMLWLSAIKTWFASSTKGALHLRRLLIAWSLLLIPAIVVAALRLLAYVARGSSSGLFRAIENRSLWHLGFWEWIGSGAVFLFLLSSALFLPDRLPE
ncbi:MAG: hypothetical protein JOZ29_08315 [Deltaproteobacteria bacterium]|nr:hypothetical protein [Deltaproteobacteria bacterium]MBV8452261.1 hypothetical protein [Deltaproteobacteria bacterium]